MTVVLARTRKAKELTQEQLAHKIGMTWGTVQRIEAGKTKAIPFDTLEKLCRALDCGIEGIIEIKKA
jgi:putative transcriptional regulator